MVDLNALPLPELFEHLAATGIDRLLGAALEEDLGLAGDLTTRSIIPAERDGAGSIVARQGGVVAGLPIVPMICACIQQPGGFSAALTDGETCAAGQELGRFTMPLRDLLAIERTVLNFIGRLSGIATLTRNYVNAIAGTAATIHDTRKSTPGLRALEKYAVRCGGGRLHRLGLYDAALYKDNHLAGIPLEQLAATLSAAIVGLRTKHQVQFVEVEVDTLAQLREVLSIVPGHVDIVLLDNMDTDTLRAAVSMRNDLAPRVRLEASGGVNLRNVRAIAHCGVDRIAVGAITHSAPALDVGLDVAI